MIEWPQREDQKKNGIEYGEKKESQVAEMEAMQLSKDNQQRQ